MPNAIQLQTCDHKTLTHASVITGAWSSRTLCELFQVTEQTLMRWRDQHELPHMIIPGDRPHMIYEPTRVLAWGESTGRTMWLDDAKRAHKRAVAASAKGKR